MLKDQIMIDRSTNGIRVADQICGILRRLDLNRGWTDLLLQVLHYAICVPGAIVLLHILPLVPQDLDGGEPLHIVLAAEILIRLVAGINLGKNDRWVMSAQDGRGHFGTRADF